MRSFRRALRLKPTWRVLVIGADGDAVREVYTSLGKRALLGVVGDEELLEAIRWIPDGPVYKLFRRLSDVSGMYDTAVVFGPVYSFKRPEIVLFEVYRHLVWHGYLQNLLLFQGYREEEFDVLDPRVVRVAALLRKTGFKLADLKTFQFADGLWVNVEGVKREDLSDEDIAY